MSGAHTAGPALHAGVVGAAIVPHAAQFLTLRGRLSLLLGLMLAMSIGTGTGRAAEPYPTRPIRIIIPAPPGGPTDSGSRIIAEALSEILGKPVVPDNRPGAMTITGTAVVAKATPDGYTLGGLTNAGLTAVTALHREIPYTIQDLSPLGIIGFDVTVITTKSNSPWHSLADVVRDAKQNPKKLTYSAAGLGSINSLGMEVLKHALGIDITVVPFTGTGPANTAVLSGDVSLGATSLSTTLPLIKSGDLRALITTAPQRLAALPDVPTSAELTQAKPPNFWVGLFAPAKTPKPVLTRLAAALARAIKDPAVVSQLQKAGLSVDFQDAAATQTLMTAEVRALEVLTQPLGLK